MVFVKSFPKRGESRAYPEWVDVALTDGEERAVEQKAREENIRLFKECLDDAREVIREKQLKPFDDNLIEITKTLFDKRASHAVFWKENACRDKFEKS